MLWNKPKCMVCEKEIQELDLIYVKMRYPKRKVIAEIKAYLRKTGNLICHNCFKNKSF